MLREQTCRESNPGLFEPGWNVDTSKPLETRNLWQLYLKSMYLSHFIFIWKAYRLVLTGGLCLFIGSRTEHRYVILKMWNVCRPLRFIRLVMAADSRDYCSVSRWGCLTASETSASGVVTMRVGRDVKCVFFFSSILATVGLCRQNLSSPIFFTQIRLLCVEFFLMDRRTDTTKPIFSSHCCCLNALKCPFCLECRRIFALF